MSTLGSAATGDTSPSMTGPTLRPYLRRKKSSLGETKIAVVGDEGVGKSALSVRFLTRRFIGEYDQSGESKYRYSTIVDGEMVAFEIMDTRSTNGDLGMREDIIRWADGFLLVYSVTSRNTFDKIAELKQKAEEGKKQQSVPIVIVGNKSDMNHIRQVGQAEGPKMATEFGCPFLEVSASDDATAVMEAFHTLSREIVEYKRRSRTFLDRVFGLKKS